MSAQWACKKIPSKKEKKISQKTSPNFLLEHLVQGLYDVVARGFLTAVRLTASIINTSMLYVTNEKNSYQTVTTVIGTVNWKPSGLN